VLFSLIMQTTQGEQLQTSESLAQLELDDVQLSTYVGHPNILHYHGNPYPGGNINGARCSPDFSQAHKFQAPTASSTSVPNNSFLHSQYISPVFHELSGYRPHPELSYHAANVSIATLFGYQYTDRP
jgi:hypothetical protein